MSRRALHWDGLRVPFVTPWSAERLPLGRIVRRRGVGGEGIGYADEHRGDRRYGALWVRYAATPGRGEPLFPTMHPLRQRQAMAHMLCGVCGKPPAERTAWEKELLGEGHLFVMRAVEGQPIAEGEKTTSPPTCLPCAPEAVNACPRLRKGYTAAVVGYAPLWGIAGIPYHPQTLQPLPEDRVSGQPFIAVDDPLLRWTLAARTVISLHEVTTVDLDELTVGAAA
ncbi:hypothetical protein ACIRD2_33260 [Streptomyces sp. NPDC093595]|uniref:hypothetical protein n=1 Tax=Streptomyces sp. NPDC093595 TaxID=3366045 RepID=UPI003807B612